MASVTAFNDMMGQFLVELHKTFPEEKSIKKMLTSFDLIKSTSPRLLVDGFMKSVTPYADKISGKDEKFILKDSKNIDFLNEIDMKKLWKHMQESTKDAVWQYLLELGACQPLPIQQQGHRILMDLVHCVSNSLKQGCARKQLVQCHP